MSKSRLRKSESNSRLKTSAFENMAIWNICARRVFMYAPRSPSGTALYQALGSAIKEYTKESLFKIKKLEKLIASGNLAEVNLLLNSYLVKIKISRDYNYPLFLSIKTGHLLIVNRLLEFDDVVNNITVSNHRALKKAVEIGSKSIICAICQKYIEKKIIIPKIKNVYKIFEKNESELRRKKATKEVQEMFKASKTLLFNYYDVGAVKNCINPIVEEYLQYGSDEEKRLRLKFKL